MINNFNKKPQFPFTYGDHLTNDGERFSDYVVMKLSDKKTQSYLTSVAGALLVIGSQAGPVRAIPPEYGEAAAAAAQGVGQDVPPLGDIVGNGMPHQHLPDGAARVGQGLAGPNLNQPNPNFGQNGMPNKPIPVPAWRLPGPPITPTGQYLNTFLLVGSVGWICLNASWGNPVFAYGCVGIVGGLINELRKRCL